MLALRGLCTLIFLVLTLPATAQQSPGGPIAPFVDQGPEDGAFLAFRDRLLAAVIAQDINMIVTMSSPNIFLEFRGEGTPGRVGHTAFRQNLIGEGENTSGPLLLYGQNAPDILRQARQAAYLDALENALRGGGTFGDDNASFTAPYLSQVNIHGPDVSAYDAYFTTFEGTALFDRPSIWGAATARLPYGEAVDLIAPAYGTRFFEIRRANGDTGFVDEQHLRPWLGYAAVFARQNGAWSMTAFNWQF